MVEDVGAFLWITGWRSLVRVDADGLRVRNGLRTYRLGWDRRAPRGGRSFWRSCLCTRRTPATQDHCVRRSRNPRSDAVQGGGTEEPPARGCDQHASHGIGAVLDHFAMKASE